MAPKRVPPGLVKADFRGATQLVEVQVAAGIDRQLSIDRLCGSLTAKVKNLGALHR